MSMGIWFGPATFHQRFKSTQRIFEPGKFKPTGIEDRDGDSLLGNLSRVRRYRASLASLSKPTLEHSIDQRTLTDPDSASNENVDPAAAPQYLVKSLLCFLTQVHMDPPNLVMELCSLTVPVR